MSVPKIAVAIVTALVFGAVTQESAAAGTNRSCSEFKTKAVCKIHGGNCTWTTKPAYSIAGVKKGRKVMVANRPKKEGTCGDR